MRFGPVPVAEALGAVLAHSTRAGGRTLKKGRVLTAAELEALAASGVATVTVAILDAGDLAEDEAARRVAEAVGGPGLSLSAPFTGRCNLYAEAAGILAYDAGALDGLNLIDEAVTLAVVPPFSRVTPGQMVGTLKIIPFAAPRAAVERAEALGRGLLRLHPFRALAAGLVQTVLPTVKPSVLDGTVETTRARLEGLGARLAGELRCAHDRAAVAAAIAARRAAGDDLVLLFGASAVVDRRDVLPAGIVAAGGEVTHFGMPVDPGNLLLVGDVGGTPVIGMPGCARSPKLNGFDWVLERLVAGLPVTRAEIMRMGAGGLLKEIASRPLPRGQAGAAPARAPRIAALVLAAGSSRRMGAQNKLLLPVDGEPMVRRTVGQVLASKAVSVTVVTGHQGDLVRAALAGLAVATVDNPGHEAGMASSLKAGIAALPADIDGVVVCLGDMPKVPAAVIDQLIAAFDPLEGRAICVPVHGGRRGNPVLWARRFLPAMQALSGDAGARALLAGNAELVAEVPVAEAGVLIDFDTPESLAAL
ncbi:MAG: molybdopterin-binding/glycosyltransferase family 2 protein [Thalassobaculales bacterium]